MNKIEHLIKNNKVIQGIYVFLGSLFFKIIGLFVKQDGKLILFSSFGGKNFNDSPKLLFEEIKRRYGNKFECVWAFVEPNKFKIEGAKSIQINSLKYFITALKAKYWVTNVNIERGLHFQKKNCVYLNTWHGICLDYIGNDRPGRKDYNFKKLNYMCVSGDFDKKIYKTAFNCRDDQFLECGMPRNDYLVKGKFDVDKLKKELGLPLDKKIILYAPTWRENYADKTVDTFESPIHLKLWKEKLGKDYIFLFRAHSITKNIMNLETDDFCYDVSSYPDTNRLLSIVDILITDYSSIALDFAILGRPIFNFGYDYDEYKQKHGFYLDYEKEMPNEIIKEEDKLIALIKNINLKEEANKLNHIKKTYLNLTTGNSIAKCVDSLFR